VLHSCCCIYFILWSGFILFCFGLENFIWNSLLNKQIKKRKKKKNNLPSYLIGPAAQLTDGPSSFPRSRLSGPAQRHSGPVGRAQQLRPFPSCSSDTWAPRDSVFLLCFVLDSNPPLPCPISPGFGRVCFALPLYKIARACPFPFYPISKSWLRPSWAAARNPPLPLWVVVRCRFNHHGRLIDELGDRFQRFTRFFFHLIWCLRCSQCCAGGCRAPPSALLCHASPPRYSCLRSLPRWDPDHLL
jgi:hypothetical protein